MSEVQKHHSSLWDRLDCNNFFLVTDWRDHPGEVGNEGG